MTAAIEVRGLTKTYGKKAKKLTALDALDLEVEKGQVYGLLGPNGAGKTTLVKILLGLRWATAGEVRILGQPALSAEVRRQVGYLPEDHRLPLYLTGMQALTIYGLLAGLSRQDIRERAKPLLERLDLGAWANQKIRKYSKGMKQRLGLAQALLAEPAILFLDEPTDGVDPLGRKVIRDMIDKCRKAGTTIFVNSHLLMEVELISDRVAILHKGRKLREGTIDELIPLTNDFEFRFGEHKVDVAKTLQGSVSSVGLADGVAYVQVAREEDLDRAIDVLRAAKVPIREILRRRQTLEDYFVSTIEKEAR